MPYSCCVPGCNGNYRNGPKVRVYSFPKIAEEAQKWIRAIKREKFTVTPSSKVCELHFTEADFEYNVSAFDEKYGKRITVEYKVPRLKEGSVPSKLPNLPAYFSNPKTVRVAPEERRKRLEEDALKAAIEKSACDNVKYNLLHNFSSIEELILKLHHIDITKWNIIKKEDSLLIVKIVMDPAPVIELSVKINAELLVNAYMGETKISKLGVAKHGALCRSQ